MKSTEKYLEVLTSTEYSILFITCHYFSLLLTIPNHNGKYWKVLKGTESIEKYWDFNTSHFFSLLFTTFHYFSLLFTTFHYVSSLFRYFSILFITFHYFSLLITAFHYFCITFFYLFIAFHYFPLLFNTSQYFSIRFKRQNHKIINS